MEGFCEDYGDASDEARATREPSPDGLGHTASVPIATTISITRTATIHKWDGYFDGPLSVEYIHGSGSQLCRVCGHPSKEHGWYPLLDWHDLNGPGIFRDAQRYERRKHCICPGGAVLRWTEPGRAPWEEIVFPGAIPALLAQAIEAEGHDAKSGVVRKDESAVPEGNAP